MSVHILSAEPTHSIVTTSIARTVSKSRNPPCDTDPIPPDPPPRNPPTLAFTTVLG